MNFKFLCHSQKINSTFYSDGFAPNAVPPTDPVIFLKPISSLITEGQKIKVRRTSEWNGAQWNSLYLQLPKVFHNVFHEVELGVIIGKQCKNVTEADAMEYVGGYCLSLDLTGMCFIKKSRALAYPWDLGKGFDTSTPVSRFISPSELANPQDIQLVCKVNGELRQSQSTSNLLFGVKI